MAPTPASPVRPHLVYLGVAIMSPMKSVGSRVPKSSAVLLKRRICACIHGWVVSGSEWMDQYMEPELGISRDSSQGPCI